MCGAHHSIILNSFQDPLFFVIPAKAGIPLEQGSRRKSGIPAFAGMTDKVSGR
jgi:hypothetical protein